MRTAPKWTTAVRGFVTLVIVNQGAQAARDRELLGLVNECLPETELQVKWLLTRIKETAPQVLTS